MARTKKRNRRQPKRQQSKKQVKHEPSFLARWGVPIAVLGGTLALGIAAFFKSRGAANNAGVFVNTDLQLKIAEDLHPHYLSDTPGVRAFVPVGKQLNVCTEGGLTRIYRVKDPVDFSCRGTQTRIVAGEGEKGADPESYVVEISPTNSSNVIQTINSETLRVDDDIASSLSDSGLNEEEQVALFRTLLKDVFSKKAAKMKNVFSTPEITMCLDLKESRITALTSVGIFGGKGNVKPKCLTDAIKNSEEVSNMFVEMRN